MTLLMLRFSPDMRSARRWMETRKAVASDPEGGYAWHALLGAAFGTTAPRPFRVLAGAADLQILAYAIQKPVMTDDREAIAAIGPAEMKPMPMLRQGLRLSVAARLRPVVRTDANGDRRRSVEMDVYHWTRKREGGNPDPETVYANWSQALLERNGVNVESIRLVRKRFEPVLRRPRQEGGRTRTLVQGTSIEIEGIVKITDASLFSQAVAGGVGRHKAFGYGMLLLRPA